MEKGLDDLCAVQICEDDECTTKEPHETIIQEMVARVDPFIDNDTREELKQMLTSYKNILSINDYDLGRAIGVLHNIDTGDTKPLRQALGRQPINHQEAIDDQVKDMLEQKVIQSSCSAWSSNVVLVKKKRRMENLDSASIIAALMR